MYVLPSCLLLEMCSLLLKVMIIGDGYVYNLIESIFYLPIIDEDGNRRDDISLGGIPPVGEITRVLFNESLPTSLILNVNCSIFAVGGSQGPMSSILCRSPCFLSQSVRRAGSRMVQVDVLIV
jgi:hypothetical protein